MKHYKLAQDRLLFLRKPAALELGRMAWMVDRLFGDVRLLKGSTITILEVLSGGNLSNEGSQPEVAAKVIAGDLIGWIYLEDWLGLHRISGDGDE